MKNTETTQEKIFEGNCDMEHGFDPNDQDQEADDEKQLAELIKQAGNEARSRNRETMSRHFEKIRAVIAEAASRRKDSAPI